METTQPANYTLTSPQLELLKWAAVITMTIDHAGFFLFGGTDFFIPMRIIGRTAFPLFAFLAAYHLYHYPSPDKIAIYAKRLLLSALIAQPFHTFAFQAYNKPFELNILFQFFVFAAGIYCYRSWREKPAAINGRQWLGVFAGIFICLLTAALSEYGLAGLLLCFICYAYFSFSRKKQKWWAGAGVAAAALGANTDVAGYGGGVLAVTAAIMVATVCLAGFMPSFRPEMKLKRMPRYFFYAYYPLHLLLLSVTAHLVGR